MRARCAPRRTTANQRLKGMEVVIDAAGKENPKAKNITVQQLLDLRFIP